MTLTGIGISASHHYVHIGRSLILKTNLKRSSNPVRIMREKCHGMLEAKDLRIKWLQQK